MRKITLVLTFLVVVSMLLGVVAGCGESATPTPTAKPAAAATPTGAAAAATPTKAAAATAAPTTAATAAATAVKGVSTGVSATQILLGTTYPLSGALSPYASIAKGLTAYYDYVNDKGGINGRKIVLKVMDDAYSAPKTVQAVKQLVEDDKVFAITSGMGSTTQLGVRDYLNENKIPQLFVNSAGDMWQADAAKYPWSIGWQPNSKVEAAIDANYIMKNAPSAKIGVIYSNDDNGKAFLANFKAALGAKASMIVSEQSYEPTAADISSQLATLKSAGADTVYWVVTGKFAAQGLKNNYALGWKPLNILVASSATKDFMMQAGAEAAEGVISTMYIKDPTDKTFDSDAGMILYRDIMKKFAPDVKADDLSPFYGMANAWTVAKVIEQAGKDVTREAVMAAAGSMNYTDCPFLLPGVTIKTSKTQWAPISQMQMQKFSGGNWARFGEVISAY